MAGILTLNPQKPQEPNTFEFFNEHSAFLEAILKNYTFAAAKS